MFSWLNCAIDFNNPLNPCQHFYEIFTYLFFYVALLSTNSCRVTSHLVTRWSSLDISHRREIAYPSIGSEVRRWWFGGCEENRKYKEKKFYIIFYLISSMISNFNLGDCCWKISMHKISFNFFLHSHRTKYVVNIYTFVIRMPMVDWNTQFST